MKTNDLSDDQLRDKALEVLTTNLGPFQTYRFLSWMRTHPRDYQSWRDSHFGGMGTDELLRRMREVDARHHAGNPNP